MKNKILVVLLCLVLNSYFVTSLDCNTKCSYGYVYYNGTCEECGKKSYNPNLRIVGGVPSNAYSWPAEVFLLIKYSGDFNVSNTILYNISDTLVCSGTLINRLTILTASHCLYISFKSLIGVSVKTVTLNNLIRSNYPTSLQIEAYIGAVNTSFIRTGQSPPYPAVKMIASSYKMHIDYDPATFLNDIALVYLPNAVEFNQYINFACLPNPSYGISYPSINSNVFATGRGWLNETSGPVQDISYNVKLTNYDINLCGNLRDSNKQICAGDLSGTKDTCFGDSGGALYAFDSNLNKYVIVGITSYSTGCARLNTPGVFTRVSYYYDWIKMNNNITCNAAVRKSFPYLFSFLVFLIAFFI